MHDNPCLPFNCLLLLLQELLVEELVHDVEDLVDQMGPKAAVRAVEAGEGVLLIEPAAAAMEGGPTYVWVIF